MKVKVLISSAYADIVGGGQKSILILLKEIDKERFHVSLHIPGEGEVKKSAENFGVDVFECFMPSFSLLSDSNFRDKLSSYLNEKQFDIIQVESFREFMWFYFLKPKKTKLIFNARVGEGWILGDMIVSLLADNLIAVSQSVLKRFFLAPRDKKTVIYNCADFFKECYTKGEVSSVAYFGRLHPGKRVDLMLCALNQIDFKGKVYIYGRGKEDYIKRLKQMAHQLDVDFKGYCDDVIKKIEKVDLIVQPTSFDEGLSRTVIESMALGKVIVASNVGSNIEALGKENSCLLFEKGNLKSLVDRLNYVMDQDLHKIGKRLYKRSKDLFWSKKNIKQYENKFLELFS